MKKLGFKFHVGNTKFGYILVKGIHVKKEFSLQKDQEAVFKDVRDKFTLDNLSKDSVVDSFRKLYWSFNMDPTKTRISSEALVRRIIKGENLWNANNIVDSLNLVSARFRLPMGYVDYETVKGDIVVRKAKKDESFVKIGGSVVKCSGNEICVADDEKIIDYGFATSDSDLTKVTEKTKDLLILVYSTGDIDHKYIQDAIVYTKELLKKATPYKISEEGIVSSDIKTKEAKDIEKNHVKETSKENKKEGNIQEEKKQTLGLTVKKDENFSEWYTQVIQKADLADYTSVSGCIVFKPYSYAIWEKIQRFIDDRLKKSGVKNCYFPMFIPESLLTREKEHVEGFTPEVAWVTHAGNEKLSERLAVRPTSETIMYESYAKWIRSYNDLPLRLNQWNNVVRWEFKNAVPFLRTREFLWHEGHTVYATKKEADEEVLEILEYYREAFEDLLSVPVIKGKKTETEKFAGAFYTTSVETFLPVGKAIQGATSHALGQNFSKAFGISFLDKEGKKQFAWQNSYAITTRSIGVMIIMHGDDKGLVLPPSIAPIEAVIVPIIFEKTRDAVLKKAQEIKKELSDFSVELDSREQYSSGWKFNEWELKGVPLRIELGPRDLENKQVVIVRRDTSAKETVKFADIKKRVPALLNDIQKNLFVRAKKQIESSIIHAKDWKEFALAAKNKKYIRAAHCGSGVCEEDIKAKTEGVKTTCIPFEQPKKLKEKCVNCGKNAVYEVLFAKSY